VAGNAETLIREAWTLYHSSFDNNEEEVVKAIIDATQKTIKFISPMNLNGTVCLLRALKRDAEASVIIKSYIDEHGGNREKFNLPDYAFGDDVTDDEIRNTFAEVFHSLYDDETPSDILLRLGKNSSWSQRDIHILSQITEDDFYTIFKANHDPDLKNITEGALKFIGDTEDDSDNKKISLTAEKALKRIGREDFINLRRVEAKYGIKPDDGEGDTDASSD